LQSDHSPIIGHRKKPIDRSDRTERQRQQPNGEPHPEARADQFTATAHLQCERDRGESTNQACYEKRCVNWTEQNAAPKTHEKCGVKPMLASKQNAQDKRREGVGGDQAAHLRLQKLIIAAVTDYQQDFRDRQLDKDHSKNEKNPRASRKALWLIDPELCNRGRQNQERNDKVLSWFRLLTTEH
jgi:hypothetical protein